MLENALTNPHEDFTVREQMAFLVETKLDDAIDQLSSSNRGALLLLQCDEQLAHVVVEQRFENSAFSELEHGVD